MISLLMVVLLAAQASGPPTLAWEHDSIDTLGYLISIDGVVTDVGLSGCPALCRWPLPPLAPGPHTFVVSAYNDSFASASVPLQKSVPQKPTGVTVVR